MEYTWERLVTWLMFEKVRFADQFERYSFFQQKCKWKNVLDIACGTWYGSHHISKIAKHVTWVDIDKNSIDFANKQYQKDNLCFLTWDWVSIQLADNSIDVVLSFETIEHIEDYHYFLSELKRVLKPWWTIIISTPNYLWELFKNPFHVSNITTLHFKDLIQKHFENILHTYYQWKHMFPIPGRWFLQVLLSFFGIYRDVKIREKKPSFDHHVTIIIAKKHI